MAKTTEERIRELKIKRSDLIEEYGNDRYNPSLLRQEKAILLEIERLVKLLKEGGDN